MPSIKITRKELYDLVWQTPMSKLAAHFGVSDVAMAKACRRWGIPKPGRGHWVKLAAGEKIRPPALPKAKSDREEWILLNYEENPAPKPPPIEPPLVSLSENLADAGRAIQSLARALTSADADSYERLLVPGRNGPTLLVTVSTHRRALLVLDSIAKALEVRGHSAVVRQETGERGRTWTLCFAVAGETVEGSLVEELDRAAHVLTDAEQKNVSQGYSYGIPKYDYHAEGRLRFSLVHAPVSPSSWSDSDTRRLEQQLGRVVLAIEAAADGLKRGREEAEKRQLEQERAQQEREREVERQRLEDQR